HNLALNWNLGEENTQTTQQQKDMAQFIADTDPYDHLIVIHTYPNQQDKIYRPLFGDASALRGASLQNSNVKDCHWQVVKWNRESAAKGKPWVIGFDEPGTAGEGMPADEGYPGMPKNFDNPSVDTTRKFALWGTLMAGGSGVEYYFGYKLPQNDLICEDWRSRDKSWDYCRIALEFFQENKIPLGEMKNEDELVGNDKHDNSAYCLAKKGELYLVYLPDGGEREIDLSDAEGSFKVEWYNPRTGGSLKKGGHAPGGAKHKLVAPDTDGDWLAVIR
ncbi:MAG: putative collagen-binding domain-containing protein, partial [Verrucomicrobiales bacterium]